mmetsp:Transcript_24116/g.53169  ORF Transcript_24116/g.53169 Transcript_24116/m.53169 type:complete len:130 (-) Transcript_24116:1069-1458(-)
MDHTELGVVGLERSLMVKVKTLTRLVEEHSKAKRKMNEVDDAKKTFFENPNPKDGEGNQGPENRCRGSLGGRRTRPTRRVFPYGQKAHRLRRNTVLTWNTHSEHYVCERMNQCRKRNDEERFEWMCVNF